MPDDGRLLNSFVKKKDKLTGIYAQVYSYISRKFSPLMTKHEGVVSRTVTPKSVRQKNRSPPTIIFNKIGPPGRPVSKNNGLPIKKLVPLKLQRLAAMGSVVGLSASRCLLPTFCCVALWLSYELSVSVLNFESAGAPIVYTTSRHHCTPDRLERQALLLLVDIPAGHYCSSLLLAKSA